MKLFELERAKADEAQAAQKIVNAAIAESRSLTEAENTKIEEHRSKIRETLGKIAVFGLADEFQPAEGRSGAGLGPDLPDLENYSLMRAIRMAVDVREGKPGAKFDGVEGEVHQELQKTKPLGSETRGVLVPWHLASHRKQFGLDRERRASDLTTTTAAGGIANILGTDLITYLRNRMVMNALGATTLTGLTGGTFALPKQTSTGTAYHVSQDGAPTNSTPALGQVVWTPRTLAARSQISRKALLQSSLDVEALVRQDLVSVLAREFDRVGVNGSGAANVPLGIMQDPNVPTTAIGTNGGAPDWATVVALETAVAVANADFGSLAYLTSNKGRGKMKQTAKIGSTYPVFLWENDNAGVGMVNGYRAMASEQVPSNLSKGSASGTLTSLIYGNFAAATYGLWSGIDILVDPYTAASSGAIIINEFQDYDFQLRYENAFAKCVDMTY